jgi:hypothetical protein
MLRTIVPAVLAACLSTACASHAAPGTGGHQESEMRTIPAGNPTSMALGESVRLSDGATLQFVRVAQDSRCPPDVQCIRAGDADIEFRFTPVGGAASTVTPNLPEAPVKKIGAWQLTVQALGFEAPAAVTLRIDAAP